MREEIGKQLEHLKRQARQAEQYQTLQEERRVKDAECKALQFRELDTRLQGLRQALLQEETRLQQLLAEQREAEMRIETSACGVKSLPKPWQPHRPMSIK